MRDFHMTNAQVEAAFADLEEFLDDADHFELVDGSTVDIGPAGKALNVLCTALAAAQVAGADDMPLMKNVIEAARAMPRATPGPGVASTRHTYSIEAGVVWTLDRALRTLDEGRALRPPASANAAAAANTGCYMTGEEIKASKSLIGAVKATAPAESEDVICPDCLGDRRIVTGALCKHCNGTAQIKRSALRPGEHAPYEPYLSASAPAGAQPSE